MGQVYTLTVPGTMPVSVGQFHDYVRLPHTMTADDATIATMIAAATVWSEKYTGRDFRDNTWELTLDQFSTRICLRRDPVVSISSVTYLKGDVETTVPASIYYLKKNVQTSEILLEDGSEWPSDGDEITAGREAGIKVTFVTEPYSCEGELLHAVNQIVANLWSERGDCTTGDAAKQSGAVSVLNQFRIARI